MYSRYYWCILTLSCLEQLMRVLDSGSFFPMNSMITIFFIFHCSCSLTDGHCFLHSGGWYCLWGENLACIVLFWEWWGDDDDNWQNQVQILSHRAWDQVNKLFQHHIFLLARDYCLSLHWIYAFGKNFDFIIPCKSATGFSHQFIVLFCKFVAKQFKFNIFIFSDLMPAYLIHFSYSKTP